MTRLEPTIEILNDLSQAPGWIDMQREYLAFAAEKHAEVTGQHISAEDQLAQTLDHIHEHFGQDGRFIVARGDGGALLGMVLLRRLANGKAEIKRLYVSPKARRQGIAHMLMAALTDEARTLGCHALYLDTSAALVDAIAMYRAMGFVDAPFDPASVQALDVARQLVILEKTL